MKILLKLITLFIIIDVVCLASLNSSQTINFSYWTGHSLNINFVYIILGLLVAGITAGFCWGGAYYIIAAETIKEYKKKLEKTSVNADCKESKVSVLEAKIEVLEKALKSALEKNNN